MTGYPCCCDRAVGTGTGTGGGVSGDCPCLANTIAGVVNLGSDACQHCVECEELNEVWYTQGVQDALGDQPVYETNGLGLWSGWACSQNSFFAKCNWRRLTNDIVLEADVYVLRAYLGNLAGRFVLWKKAIHSVGSGLPTCEDIEGLVCDFDSKSVVTESHLDCDFSSSTVTVNEFVPGVGVSCPIHGCSGRSGLNCPQDCFEGRVPVAFELTIPDGWVKADCQVNSATGTCDGAGTYATDKTNHPYQCRFGWQFNHGGGFPLPPDFDTQQIVFTVCSTPTRFSVLAEVTRVLNFDPEGRAYSRAVTFAWMAADLGFCGSTDLGDCFFGGNPVSIPYLGATINDQDGGCVGGIAGDDNWAAHCGDLAEAVRHLCPREAWMNWCCDWDGQAVTLTPILQ